MWLMTSDWVYTFLKSCVYHLRLSSSPATTFDTIHMLVCIVLTTWHKLRPISQCMESAQQTKMCHCHKSRRRTVGLTVSINERYHFPHAYYDPDEQTTQRLVVTRLSLHMEEKVRGPQGGTGDWGWLCLGRWRLWPVASWQVAFVTGCLSLGWWHLWPVATWVNVQCMWEGFLMS